MCLLLFAPYLNLIAEKISQKEFKLIIICGLIIFSLVPTFLHYDIMQDGGKGLINMILLYYIGRYIRIYGNWKMKKLPGIILLTSFFLVIYKFLFASTHTNMYALNLQNDNSITVILIAIIMLYLFKDLEFRSNTINQIASHIFGIYILNVPVLQILNHYVFKMDESKISGNSMPLWLFAWIFAAMIICYFVDVLHNLLLLKFETKIIDLVIAKFTAVYDKDNFNIINHLKKILIVPNNNN